jgi:hypothetical protein
MAIAEKELVVKSGRKGAALTEADLQAAAQPIIDDLEAKITDLAAGHYQEVLRRIKAKNQGQALTDPVTENFFVPPYNWWDMFLVGPFQFTGGPAGPFLANRVIKAGELAFYIAVVWRNPAPIGWAYAGPSSATMMSPLNLQVRLESSNMSTMTDGPDFVPAALAPLGPGPIDAFVVPVSFPAPPQGEPHLYEINMTADVSGPVPGIPFAGYSTWVLDYETELPFLFLPAGPIGLKHDVPSRVLVYTA